MPEVRISVPQDVWDALDALCKGHKKPPRELPDGSTIIEPMFPQGPASWITGILQVNIRNTLGSMPTPAVKQILQEIEERKARLDALISPAVEVVGEAPQAVEAPQTEAGGMNGGQE